MKSEKVKQLKLNLNKVSNLLKEGQLEAAKEILQMLTVRNESYFTTYSNYFYLKGDFQGGINLLEEGIKELPYSFEILFNLASLKSIIGELVEAAFLFAKCCRLAITDERKGEASNQLKEIIAILENSVINSLDLKAILEEIDKISKEKVEVTYPLNRYEESLVRKVLVDSQQNEYLLNLYKAMNVSDINKNLRFFLKTELLKGRKGKEFCYTIENPTTFPISLFSRSGELQIEGPGENYTFEQNVLDLNQYNYLSFSQPGQYKFTSNNLFFMGNPMNLKPTKRSPQLIITVFIDGLSNDVIENDLDHLMPSTAKFFSTGYRNNNCYTTGDWTLPSVASMYTGKTVINHNLYHAHNHLEINQSNKLFTSYFKENGYMTAQINNNWRITPTVGYLEDMDRIVYQHFMGGFTANEVVGEAIEHLEAFKENNHFLWVGIEDLHDIADEINNDLLSQVHVDGKYRQKKNVGVTSVLSPYDFNKVKKYEAELKRIDFHLSTLYNYLENNFGKENILVSLISDHGQTYLKEDDFLLHEPKRKVPFMIVGKDVESKISDEISSILDLFPTLAKLAKVEMDVQEGVVLKDFGGEGRKFALTETIHPGQPYLIAITDSNFIFRFKSHEKLNGNGVLDLDGFEATLLDKGTLADVTQLNLDVFESYCDFVIERALKLQK